MSSNEDYWSFQEGELAVLRTAADEAARHVRTLYFIFLLFALYVAITIFLTTDEQLLLERSHVQLPVFDVELPLTGFYVVVPVLVLIFHAHLLSQFFLLSRKLFNLDRALRRSLPPELEATHRELPFPLIFSYVIVGRHHPVLIRWAFKTAVIFTILLIPIVLLMITQYRFLSYHSEQITFGHQLAVTSDLLLLWFFWPRLFSRSGRWWPWSRSWRMWAFWPRVSFRSGYWRVRWSRPRRSRMSMWGALVLTGLLLFAIWTLLDLRSADFRKMDLQGRDLRRAQLQGADLWKAQLQGADLRKAQLQGAKLWGAQLQGAKLRGAQLQDAKLGGAQLQGTNLKEVELRSTTLWWVRLQGADLSDAQLQGANLFGARLQGTDLSKANLQGANLFGARLQGTDLSKANLQGANLFGARLQGTDLSKANLQGANLFGARLQGTDLSKANLQGADLRRANLQGANLSKAQLQGADLREAVVYGTRFQDAKLSLADLRGLYLPDDGLEQVFSEAEALEKMLEQEGAHWSQEGRERIAEAIERFRSITSDSSSEPMEILPTQGSKIMHDQQGLFADWPAPPDVAEFEQARADYRAELRAELACTDRYIAKSMRRQAEFESESEIEDSPALAEALRAKAESGKCPVLAEVLKEDQ
ncbi:pentapeptide repeat-containing protein [Candidatus Thiosymbion oneisti]|uniref:pentapeptide repeat-containing protein n=1 Tax=Candidatus Thiosymbion oneisti TaxID=589554 RepID=UPI0013FD35B6|nr:pentapeptide repeat-containing protein [Candidatus Thiosymbion oneisti]